MQEQPTRLASALAAEPAPRQDPAEQLWRLWRQGQRPDVDTFLAQAGSLSPVQAAAVLRLDQRERWQLGERVPAEVYLQRHPDLRAHPEAVLDLIYHEFFLRERGGEQPNLEEYLRRFPEYADLLRRQIELHRALGFGQASTQPGAAATPGSFPVVTGYEVLRELGRGGMGVVYLARHLSLKRLVALKMILGGSLADPEQLARFRVEAEVVARLQHPQIVQIYDIGEQEGRPFVALEYVDGGSLDKQLVGTPQPARVAAQLLETLARAMQVAHAHGIIHRDLKPANILLQKDEGGRMKDELGKSSSGSSFILPPSSFMPKISDFGLAKMVDVDTGQTPSGAILGTPSYMAPEQARGKVHVLDARADVYALGAILYELLTGRPPFTGETPLDTLQQVLADEPVPPRRLQPKVPRDLETICLKCLQKDPRRRYATAEALADDLRRFGAGEPIQARPVSSIERLGRWGRRKPAVASLAAALVLVVAGALVSVTGLWLRAEHLHAAALADFRLARESVDSYATRVSENLRLRQEDLRPLRKELLETVVPFYEKLIERHADATEVQAERAQAYKRLAQITKEIADKSQACALYEQAVAILERLTHAHPGSRDYQRDLAECRNDLAGLYYQTGRASQAEAEFRKLLQFLEHLTQAHPDDPAYHEELAHSHNDLAVLYLETGQRSQAEGHLLQALDILEPQIRQHPDVPDLAQHAATSRSILGLLHYGAGRLTAAETEYQEALRLLEALVRQQPGVAAHQRELASTLNYLGQLNRQTGRLAPAEVNYEKALKILEILAGRHPSVTEYRSELAVTLGELASLYHATGRVAEAEAASRKVVDIHEQLVRQNPSVPAYQHQLAERRSHLGGLYLQTGRASQAEAEFQKAWQIHHELVRQDPGVPEFQHQLALGHNNLAGVYQQTGRLSLAETEYARALQLLTPLADRHAQVATYQDTLSQCRLSLGTLYLKTGRGPQAEEEYRQAAQTNEQLARANPSVTSYAVNLGAIYSSMGTAVHSHGKKSEAALDWFGRSIAVLEGVLRKAPDEAAAKVHLRDVHAKRARALGELGRHAQAIGDLDRALALDNGQRGEEFRARRAQARARLGEHAEALAEAAAIGQRPSVPAATLHTLAGVYALSSGAAHRDSRLPTADQDRLAEQYAARAVELLVKAQAAGYLKNPSQIEHLKQDPDLDSLRPRADFQKLLQRVEAKEVPKEK